MLAGLLARRGGRLAATPVKAGLGFQGWEAAVQGCRGGVTRATDRGLAGAGRTWPAGGAGTRRAPP